MSYYIAKYCDSSFFSILHDNYTDMIKELVCIEFKDLSDFKEILQEKILPILMHNESEIILKISLTSEQVKLLISLSNSLSVLEIFSEYDKNKLINLHKDIILTLIN